MTPSEREEIEKVALEVIDYASLFSDGEAQYQNLKKGIINAILTQVAKARAEALEEAAKIVENHSCQRRIDCYDKEKKYVVEEIRNKLEKE